MIGWLLKLATGNPVSLLWIGGGLFAAGLLMGGGSAWTVQGWRMKAQETEWQTREAKINAETAIKIEAANRRVREIEQDIAQLLANESAGYQAKLKEKDDALSIALDSVATVGMFSHSPACPPVGGNATGGTTAGTSGHNGAARAKLPDEDAKFLLSEASRADKVVLQLTACQGVVRADRAQQPVGAK